MAFGRRSLAREHVASVMRLSRLEVLAFSVWEFSDRELERIKHACRSVVGPNRNWICKRTGFTSRATRELIARLNASTLPAPYQVRRFGKGVGLCRLRVCQTVGESAFE